MNYIKLLLKNKYSINNIEIYNKLLKKRFDMYTHNFIDNIYNNKDIFNIFISKK